MGPPQVLRLEASPTATGSHDTYKDRSLIYKQDATSLDSFSIFKSFIQRVFAMAATHSGNTSSATFEKEVVLNDDATVRGQTAGAQSTSPLFHQVSEQQQPEPTTSDNEEVPEYITGIRLYLVLAGVTAVMFLVMLDMTIVVTAIPSISNDFDSIKDIGWYGTAYLLCS